MKSLVRLTDLESSEVYDNWADVVVVRHRKIIKQNIYMQKIFYLLIL